MEYKVSCWKDESEELYYQQRALSPPNAASAAIGDKTTPPGGWHLAMATPARSINDCDTPPNIPPSPESITPSCPLLSHKTARGCPIPRLLSYLPSSYNNRPQCGPRKHLLPLPSPSSLQTYHINTHTHTLTPKVSSMSLRETSPAQSPGTIRYPDRVHRRILTFSNYKRHLTR